MVMKRVSPNFLSALFCLFALSALMFVSAMPVPASAADVVSVSSAGADVSAVPAVSDEVGASATNIDDGSGFPVWLQWLSLIISAASVIAMATPTPKDDNALSILRKLVDLLALNFGGAKNAGNPKDNLRFR